MLNDGNQESASLSTCSGKENWRQLAEQASKENDPKKLLVLVQALCRTLEERDAARKSASHS